jgi:hypothetical protein
MIALECCHLLFISIYYFLLFIIYNFENEKYFDQNHEQDVYSSKHQLFASFK